MSKTSEKITESVANQGVSLTKHVLEMINLYDELLSSPAEKGSGSLRDYIQRNNLPQKIRTAKESLAAAANKNHQAQQETELALFSMGIILASSDDDEYRKTGESVIDMIMERNRQTKDTTNPVNQLLTRIKATLGELSVFIQSRRHSADFFLPEPTGNPLADKTLRLYYQILAENPVKHSLNDKDLQVECIDLANGRFCLFYGFPNRQNFQQEKSRLLTMATERC